MVKGRCLKQVVKVVKAMTIREGNAFIINPKFQKLDEDGVPTDCYGKNDLIDNLKKYLWNECEPLIPLAFMTLAGCVNYSIEYDVSLKESYNAGSVRLIEFDGCRFWFVNGVLHRDNDLPACEYVGGTNHWYKKGVRHRDNGLPAIITDERRVWYMDGLLHRNNDLPAVVFNTGKMEWYINNNLFREDGEPNVVSRNGRGTVEREGGRYCTYKDTGDELEPSLFNIVCNNN